VNGSSWDCALGASYVWDGPMMSGSAPPPTSFDQVAEPPSQSSQSGTPNGPPYAGAPVDHAC
jgi:hypothetical protein